MFWSQSHSEPTVESRACRIDTSNRADSVSRCVICRYFGVADTPYRIRVEIGYGLVCDVRR